VWTSALELSEISLQYSAHVFALRKTVAIENRIELRDGVKHGFFRLAQPKPKPLMPTQAVPVENSGLLFEDFHSLPKWHDPEEGARH